MNLDLTEDQRQMLDTVSALCARAYPLARLRDGGPENVAPLADLGLFAADAGLSLADQALLHTRLGRHLLCPSVIATTVAAGLVPAEDIAGGARRVAAGVALDDDLLLFGPPDAALAVWRSDDGLRWGPIGPARPTPAAGDGLALARAPRPKGQAAPADLWQLLTAAHLLGLAEGALALAVAHAQTREQFGRPIGSFQALKHRAADMELAAAMLSAQLDMAALRQGQPDGVFQMAALVHLAPQVALANARACIQMHGGLGFSAEAAPHLFLKQAHRLALMLLPVDLLAPDAPLSPTTGGP